MEGILLTDTELKPIMEAAVWTWSAWTVEQKRAKPWREYSREVACRAQVRKVCDEYEKAINAPSVKGADCLCDSCRTRRFMQALHAAGGE